ncbi:MAG: cytochrome c-type biogenesis protein [Acidimicrobiales bacterium]
MSRSGRTAELSATPADRVLDGAPERAGEGSGEPSRRPGHRTPWWPWLLLVAVVGALLVVGVAGARPPATQAERVNEVARTVRCPTCQGESVAQSEAEISKEIRLDIARRLEQGQSEEQVRDFYVARYGEGILLEPSGSGVSGLVWALPVIALVLAVAGLVAVFRRWQVRGEVHATDADEALVAQALRADAATPGTPDVPADGDDPPTGSEGGR